MHHVHKGFRRLVTQYFILIWNSRSHIIDLPYDLLAVANELSFVVKLLSFIFIWQIVFFLVLLLLVVVLPIRYLLNEELRVIEELLLLHSDA